MKKVSIIRLLVGLNMILFILPFFNACSERKENDNELLKSIQTIKDNDLRQDMLDIQVSRFEYNKKRYDEMNQNAYQLAITPFKDADKSMFSEPYFYFCLCFTVIVILNIIMLSFSLIGRLGNLQMLNTASLSILLLSLLIPLFSGILKNIEQIKIGFYLYLINLVVIAWLLKQIKGEKNTA